MKSTREDMVGEPSILFTGKDVVYRGFYSGSDKLMQKNVAIDASHQNPSFMYQAMPTGLHTRWELGSESGKFKPRQNRTKSFENMVKS